MLLTSSKKHFLIRRIIVQYYGISSIFGKQTPGFVNNISKESKYRFKIDEESA